MRYCPNCFKSYGAGEKDSCGLTINILCPKCGAELNKKKPTYFALIKGDKNSEIMFAGTKKECDMFIDHPSGWAEWLGRNPRWQKNWIEMVVNKVVAV